MSPNFCSKSEISPPPHQKKKTTGKWLLNFGNTIYYMLFWFAMSDLLSNHKDTDMNHFVLFAKYHFLIFPLFNVVGDANMIV